ncbi:glycosyltransferase [Vibrio fluvialis]|nr:glycosyltransferase [Vibrio fluvialis]
MNKLISVIMPVYNVERYIYEAVDSILQQTYDNFELIIIDDFSNDKTFTIAQSFVDERVKVIKNNQKKGIVGALNSGLAIASGDFIARVDGDDVAMPDRFERQVAYLNSNSEIDLVGFSLIGIDEKGSITSKLKYSSGYSNLISLIKFGSPVSHIWLSRKYVYDDLNGYRIDSCEDYDFLLRMITKGYKFDNIPNYYGMKIRVRKGNTIDYVGVRQRKARDYAYKLYKRRVKNQVDFDDFSEENLNKFCESSELEINCYRYSSKIINRALQTRSKVAKAFLYCLAFSISSYQAKYLIRRAIFKLKSK